MKENYPPNIYGEIMKNKILTIGPVTKDLIITPTEQYYQIGGAVYYQSNTLEQLKKEHIAIISVGKDDVKNLDKTLKKQELILQEKTLEYTNIYNKKLQRTQKAKFSQNTITPNNININLNQIQYAIISPLTPNDIPPETIKHLKNNNIQTVLVAQGYLRKTDENNNILKRKWTDKEKYLENTDILCLDEEETKQSFNINNTQEETIKKILNKHNLKQLIITQAEKGSTIYTQEKTYKIPAIKTDKNVDATGLGDTYIAAYIAKLEETNNIQESGLFASITAKEKLQHKGPLKTSKEKIEKELDKYR